MPNLRLGFQAMDSPETSKLITSTASDSPPLQDSPFSDFISNLSPITHVKSTHNIVRGLSRLNSPPIVFKSPRTKQQNETNILKRSESLLLSNLEASRSIVNVGKECGTQKGCEYGVTESFETHPSSSSGCVDEFLADPGDADGVNSAKSATPVVKQSNNSRELDQSCSGNSKRTVLQFDSSNGRWVDSGTNLDAFLFSSEQTECDVQGEAKLIEIEGEQNNGEWSNGCPNTETSFHGDRGFTIQTCQILQAQKGFENERRSDQNYNSQLSAEPFPVQTFEDHVKEVGGASDRLADNIMCKSQKVNENHRGVRRRCLQFEEAPLCTIRPTGSSLNLAHNVNSLKRSKSSHVESKEAIERHMSNSSQSNATLKHSRSSENISMALKPLGIGLHLNSIVSAASQSFTATVGKKSTDQCVSVGGLKLSALENKNSCSRPSSVTEKDSVTNEETLGSTTKALIITSSVSGQFPHAVEDQFAAIDESGKSNSRNADGFEEHDQTSPRKKRKKTTSSDGADGCKRCSCKKTKCLKLYCDCFAAGVYCTDPCGCQGCFNKQEYKDKVLETREQIESRNPHAFAPKIVQLISELPPDNGEDGNGSTPSSARHKRGCNCKKSMCLKKYCECFQANVGCSSGCRCEGCKNVYGRKEVHVAIEYRMTREEVRNKTCTKIVESAFDKDSEMVEINRELLLAESINLHSLTPQTPSFQHSDQGKAAPKSRFLSERYHTSPDSDILVISSYEKPTKSPLRDVEKSNGVVFETCEASQNEGFNWQADNNKGRFYPILSICDSVSDAHHGVEFSDTPIPMIPTSLKGRDHINKPQNQQCPGNDHLSSDSLTRHGSPLTPMTRLGGTKNSQGSFSDCELIDVLEDNETPVTVKVSSPNKKRVSPPFGHIYKLGSGSSGALRSGRKFILKSVPSFPPLTPCIDSKGSSASQDSNKLQDIN